MGTILLFIFKSILVAGIFLLYYWLVLRQKRMHAFNRFYLLGVVVCSLAIPLCHFRWTVSSPVPAGAGFVIRNIDRFGPGEVGATTGVGNQLRGDLIAYGLYILVAAWLLCRTIVQVRKVYLLRNRLGVCHKQGYRLVETTLPQAPFSFMNTLFWNSNIPADSEDGQRILIHELNHIRQWHTLDKLFLQLVTALFWINPFYWLVRQELSLQHEFLADEAAISPHDTASFARMLLTVQHPGIHRHIVHSFFHSSIQRRLFMITQPTKVSNRMLRSLLVLPLLCSLVFLLSFDTDDQRLNKARHRVVLVLDAAHGGSDIGGRNDEGGLEEKKLTAVVCNKIKELAARYNIEVVPTRKDDINVSMEQRIKVSNAGAGDLFISVHINKSAPGAVEKGSGYELILSNGNPQFGNSKVLASAIHAAFGEMKLQARLIERKLYVLTNNQLPAIAIECGFIDNPENMAVIMDDQKLEAFCQKILAGVVSYDNYLHGHQ